jgi:DNA-binding ferritin-like protein
MKQLTILLRAMQLYYHQAHNIVSGPTFFSDHEFLGGLYKQTEVWYDSVTERFIGQDNNIEKVDLVETLEDVLNLLKDYPMDSDAEHLLSQGLEMEQSLCQMINQLCPSQSEGTKQLIGDIADQSEARQYLLQRRLLSGGKAN